MYKLKLTLMSAGLLTATMMVGGSLASMQERNTNSQQTNQNNSNQNRNSNRGSRGNSNANRGGNMNSGMMNSNMMNSNSSMMNSNSGMGSGSMSSNMDMMGLTTIGNMSVEEFMRINAQGAANVAAVTPTSAPLSKSDQKLMMQVAMGGMMQLEVSRAALPKVTSPQAKVLAQSEVDEQTGLSAKLQEIASAKGVTLPTAPDPKAQSIVSKMQNMSGAQLDRFYVSESGVKGHVKLDKTMSKVETKATDDTLKALAMAAHPLVRTHLQVSREVVSSMSGSGSSMNSNSNRGSRGNSNGNSNSNSNR